MMASSQEITPEIIYIDDSPSPPTSQAIYVPQSYSPPDTEPVNTPPFSRLSGATAARRGDHIRYGGGARPAGAQRSSQPTIPLFKKARQSMIPAGPSPQVRTGIAFYMQNVESGQKEGPLEEIGIVLPTRSPIY